MKRIIRLTEGDLIKLINRVINEQKEKEFYSQHKVDSVLDKINKKGMGSLSDIDKNILDNPNEDWENAPSDSVQTVINTLKELGWIDMEYVNVYGDHFELYLIEGEQFDYFNLGNYLIFDVEDEGDIINIYIRGEDYGEEDDVNSKEIVTDYIINNWADVLSEKGIELYVDDDDDDDFDDDDFDDDDFDDDDFDDDYSEENY